MLTVSPTTMPHAQRFKRTNSGDSKETAHYRTPLHELLRRAYLSRSIEYEVVLVPAASNRQFQFASKSRLFEAVDSNLRTSQSHDLTQMDKEAATGGARRLLARSRLPPLRGHTPPAPRYLLPCVGCLKQMPNAVFQQFDSPLQGAELSDTHYRDGHVQVK